MAEIRVIIADVYAKPTQRVREVSVDFEVRTKAQAHEKFDEVLNLYGLPVTAQPKDPRS